MSLNQVPAALYQANLAFAQRIGRLLQEHQQKWLALGVQSVTEDYARLSNESAEAFRAWQKASAAALGELGQGAQAPVSDFWNQLARQAEATQAFWVSAIAKQGDKNVK